MTPKQSAAAAAKYAAFLQERAKYNKIDRRARTIEALAADGTPEARKQRRRMNDQIVPKRASGCGDFYRGAKGYGKTKTRAVDDSARVLKQLRARNGY